ncbi:MAG: hypothetical protein R3B45_18450 [Bdellovibrionota bacterium]
MNSRLFLWSLSSLVGLAACGLNLAEKDSKKGNEDNTISEALSFFVPAEHPVDDGEANDQIIWNGQCMAPESEKADYRMLLIGGKNKGRYNVSGNGSKFDSEDGLYKASKNTIQFGGSQADTFGYDAMSCQAYKGEVVVNGKTYKASLECALLRGNNISFFSDCQQLRFVSDKALKEIPQSSSTDISNSNQTASSTTVILVPEVNSPWAKLDTNEDKEVFEADLSGNCDNEERKVTLIVDKNLYTVRVAGSDHSDSGPYSFDNDTDTLELLDESPFSNTVGSCKINSDKVTCQFKDNLKISFFEKCPIARFPVQ